MKRDDYWAKPKKVRNGWWYANKGSIDVVHQNALGVVRITRGQILQYIQRTAKK